MSKVKLEQLTYQEHPEQKLRDALGVLVGSWPLHSQPAEADIVMDGIIEALRRRKAAKRCPDCSKVHP